MTKQRIHLAELTSTRFLAAFAVLLGHFKELLSLPPFVADLVGGGHNVSFFFALSGFILCYRYWDTFAEGVTAPGLRLYFVSRVGRIYPSYALALVLLTGLYLIANALRPGTVTYPPNPVTSWLVNLLALQTYAPSIATQQYWNAPGWSISTELSFYVIFPVVLAWIARHCNGRASLLWLLGLTTALGILAQGATLILVYRYGWSREFWLDIVASRNIFWRMQQFMIGVVAARLLYGGYLAALSRPAVRNAVLLGGLAVTAAMNLAPWPEGNVAPVIMRQFRLEVAYMFPFAAIIVALAAGNTFLSGFLQRPFLVLLGNASFAVYIFHWIPWIMLMHAKHRGWDPHPLLVTVVILLTILFSIASYLWYEKPARMYFRRKFAQ